ncbi:MAG: sigma-54-dependent Fis family transcriptional regulator [Gammaproteobacteria bacterium]|nr:sigma-54-dependent Fis family transcriptional regulator [Gammaproteobacteria bacterium]
MSDRYLVLLIDDEPDILELLTLTLARMEIDADTAADIQQARQRLSEKKYDLCLTDMRLPDGNGIELVEHIQQHYPELPVAMITAHGNMDAAVAALKAGAFDFVSKPVDLAILRKLVNAALKLSPRDKKSESTPREILLGDSEAIKTIRSKILKLARSQAPVYISGESGSGKELVARLIHDKGPRADKAFVPVNCGAIPEQLMESEFFGHKKGSFTGANTDKPGLFQAADGGTLFLDEVADLPLHMQVKLLRAIQEKAVRPVGAAQEIPVDVRILSATHKDLAKLVAQNQFRQDLYYRINVIELHVPSLRERREDIPLLAEHLLTKIAATMGTDKPKLSTDAETALHHHAFPGNVRELENILERAATLCEHNVIQAADLHLPAISAETSTQPATLDIDQQLADQEKNSIMRALEQTRFNKTAAAKLLGITFRQLRYRLKKLGLE